MNISRSVYRYRCKQPNDAEIAEQLRQLAERKPRWGFRKMFQRLRNQGYRWNHKRVRRVYRQQHLNLRVKPKKRLPSRQPTPLAQPESANESWSVDFMSDSLQSGQTFRTFNVIDDFNREALAIEIDTSLPSGRVVRVLDIIADWRGYPRSLRSDNGPELISQQLESWAEKHDVLLDFIEPGKPAQNAYIERFNRTYREDVLDFYLFSSLADVREITEQWLEEYNAFRPHASLGGMTPYQYATVNVHEPESVHF
jgi:putative transposase